VLKKLASILFLGIMLFNAFGYRIVANYFDQKAADSLATVIEQNDYNEADLITIKTPINLPYYSNNPRFEKTEGTMTIDGVVYQYVERRVYNDSIEIRVLNNQERQKIKNAKEQFAQLASDIENKNFEKKSTPVNKPSNAKFIGISSRLLLLYLFILVWQILVY
jgi:hypothetical protein